MKHFTGRAAVHVEPKGETNFFVDRGGCFRWAVNGREEAGRTVQGSIGKLDE